MDHGDERTLTCASAYPGESASFVREDVFNLS